MEIAVGDKLGEVRPALQRWKYSLGGRGWRVWRVGRAGSDGNNDHMTAKVLLLACWTFHTGQIFAKFQGSDEAAEEKKESF